MKKLLSSFLTCLLAFTIAHAQQQQQAPQLSPLSPQPGTTSQFPEASAFANSDLTYKIIDAPNSTYCYDVFVDGRLVIHQTSAPGLPGNEGFKAKEDARKVAELVIEKIRKGEMPPTVTIDEMKILSIVK